MSQRVQVQLHAGAGNTLSFFFFLEFGRRILSVGFYFHR
jgi:hypothetical protein